MMRKAFGIPLLGHLLDRLGRCKGLDGVVVATSSDATDEMISKYAHQRGVPCFRGELNDVAARLLGAASQFGIQHMARISADSPMLDPAIVSQALEIYRSEHPHLATNVQERTFPKGQSVEILSVETLSTAWNSGMSDSDKEHVTPYFYRHTEAYSIRNLRHPEPRVDVQLSVDVEEDFLRFERILDRLGAPYWSHNLESILSVYDSLEAGER